MANCSDQLKLPTPTSSAIRIPIRYKNTKPGIVQLSALMEGFRGKSNRAEWLIQKPLSFSYGTHQSVHIQIYHVCHFWGLISSKIMNPHRTGLIQAGKCPGSAVCPPAHLPYNILHAGKSQQASSACVENQSKQGRPLTNLPSA